MGPRIPSKEQQRRAVLARQTKRDLRDELAEVKADLYETREKRDELDAQIEALENALWDIRDWFDSVLVRHEPMRDPRKMLQRVERELGL